MLRLLLALLCCASVGSSQTFWVGPGGQYADLPQAVAAVPSGATLRVQAGLYSPFQIANKSLTILGDGSGQVVVALGPSARVVVGPLGPADRVVLHGMALRGLLGSLTVQSAAGEVRLDDVDIAPAAFQGAAQIDRASNVHLHRCNVPGLTIVDSSVEIAHCSISGGLNTGLPALDATDSHVVLYDSTCIGGQGRPGSQCSAPGIIPGTGGSGVLIAGASTLHAVAGSIDGGAGSDDPCTAGGMGGVGLDVRSGTARIVGTTVRGGSGSPPGAATSVGSTAALEFPTTPAVVADLVGTPGPGQTITCALQAGPGNPAVLFLGYEAVYVPAPATITTGALLVLPALAIGPWVVPATGRLDLPFVLPPSWPVDRPIPFQFAVLSPAATEIWCSNSDIILAKS